jgi:hypothetical protein
VPVKQVKKPLFLRQEIAKPAQHLRVFRRSGMAAPQPVTKVS